jgi:hypothetical protein
MKAKIKKLVLDISEENIIDIINIDTADFGINIHFLFNNEYYKYYFEDNKEVNEYIEFNYKENKVCSNEVLIKENEVNKRIAELAKKKDEEVEYWKTRCMRLLDKI